MNFNKIPPVPTTIQILDITFRKAREHGQQKNLKGNWLQIIRAKEALKLDVVKDSICNKLEGILSSFPQTCDLPQFYQRLLTLTLEPAQLKKGLASLVWAEQQIKKFQKEYVHRVIKEKDPQKVKLLSGQAYGRISSVLKQISKQLEYLEECRQIMRTYPDIKEMFTVCVYGFPNVGKTSLLNKLTGTKAKVAAYAFTTKSINSGFIEIKGHQIQMLDVPGTLARPDKMNLIELQAELVLEELAKVIIFVMDLTQSCGYTIKQQEELLKKVHKKKKVLVYLSKNDITAPEMLEEFKLKYYSLEEIKVILGEMVELEIKEKGETEKKVAEE